MYTTLAGRGRGSWRLASLLLLISALSALSYPAQAAEKPAQLKKPLDGPTLLVFDLTNDAGVDKGVANTLVEIVIERITDLKKYNVVGQKDLDKMLFWEQNKQLKGCTDTSCLVQIAGAMGAQYYVEGSIGGVGDQYVVTLKLIDAGSVRVLERVTEKIKKDDNTLAKTIEPAVDVIMGVKRKEAQATVAPGGRVDKKFWGMTGTCAGAGVVVLGGVFSVLAKKAGDDYRAGETTTAMEDLASKNDTYSKLAITAYVAGGALAATGGVLWYLGANEEKGKSVRVFPLFDGTTPGVSVGGNW
jgi:TolB-like protein